MTQRNEPAAASDLHVPSVTLRNADELADALPYFMGFHPSDSLVLVALQGERGQFAGRVRLGIPEQDEDWEFIGGELPRCLVQEVEQRAGGVRPDGVVAYLCREPGAAETGRQVMERLRPLADALLTSCAELDLRVLEVLCLSDGRYWSYVCTGTEADGCCPPEGRPMLMPGTSVMAASAAFAGIQVRGTQQEMEARLTPRTGPAVAAQEEAIDAAVAEAFPRLLGGHGKLEVAADTLALVSGLIARLEQNPPSTGAVSCDAGDDRLLTDTEAAQALVGLQDPPTRDRALFWMEGPQAAAALRLWRALARRCVGVYEPYGAVVRTLAGWVAWSLGDPTEARLSLELALAVEPDCTLAQLMYEATGANMPPDALREGLRTGMSEYPPLNLPASVWPPATGEEDTVQGELFDPHDVRNREGANGAEEAAPEETRRRRPGAWPSVERTVRSRGSARKGSGPRGARPESTPPSVPRQRRRSAEDISERGGAGAGDQE